MPLSEKELVQSGLYFKLKREEAGLTQRFVARKLGYSSPQFVSNWERGLASIPISTIVKVTDLYSISPEEVIGELTNLYKESLRGHFFGKK